MGRGVWLVTVLPVAKGQTRQHTLKKKKKKGKGKKQTGSAICGGLE